MNSIELYKKLPKKNCGECRQKTCMPFALSVIKGEADLSECPYLTEGQIGDIQASLVRKDWREELIARLKEDVRNIKFSEIADDIGAELRGEEFIIRCLGRDFIVSPDGEIKTDGHITPWIKILLLHYIKTSGRGGLSGKWVSYSELRGGMVKISSFNRDCEDPLRELFISDFEKTSMALNRFGAEMCEVSPARNAWHLFLLPKVPVLILYWPKEDEFEPKVKILFDSTADRFLDAESLIFLVEGLIKNIEVMLKKH